jgi:hypothetical protein
MSVNWVSISSNLPVELPEEKFKLSNNVDFTLSLVSTSVKCVTCKAVAFISNRRLIVLPKGTVNYHVSGRGDRPFDSFASDVKRIYGAKLIQPWFGPNAWQADILPAIGGGLEPDNQLWRVDLVFKDGGAFDFTDMTALQVTNARENDGAEPLPAYEP